MIAQYIWEFQKLMKKQKYKSEIDVRLSINFCIKANIHQIICLLSKFTGNITTIIANFITLCLMSTKNISAKGSGREAEKSHQNEVECAW